MESKIKPVINWLILGCFLVSLMVVIGGITRLTQSGLSMVEWNLIMGSIPPLTEEAWLETFDAYKSSPEYKIVNYDFSLQEFKSIFWWEYIHRLLGRLIGIIFIVPFAVFWFQKRISKKLLGQLLVIFVLGAFQGFMGWFMVKSGLIRDPHVSHFRLAAHLLIAFGIIGAILWTVFEIKYSAPFTVKAKNLRKWTITAFVLFVIQVIYGAFVAGLKAGLYYNTWPKMGFVWIPSETSDSLLRDGFGSLINNITMLQFIHRYLAYVVLVICIFTWLQIRKSNPAMKLMQGANFLLIGIFIQFLLGVLTLVYKVPVILGVLHQLGALLLFVVLVFLVYATSNKGDYQHTSV